MDDETRKFRERSVLVILAISAISLVAVLTSKHNKAHETKKTYPSHYLYVGEDGKIHRSWEQKEPIKYTLPPSSFIEYQQPTRAYAPPTYNELEDEVEELRMQVEELQRELDGY